MLAVVVGIGPHHGLNRFGSLAVFGGRHVLAVLILIEDLAALLPLLVAEPFEDVDWSDVEGLVAG
ncbi:MAG TPA: hypothetical protein VHX44_00675, partial [Planctomycetota bacterium]|nr:hypothetical protein [Planctomycetota bacterium]